MGNEVREGGVVTNDVAGVGFKGVIMVRPCSGMMGGAVVGERAAVLGASARTQVMPNLSTGGVGGACNEAGGIGPLFTPELPPPLASWAGSSCSSVHNCV
jgi:hypothetical protein